MPDGWPDPNLNGGQRWPELPSLRKARRDAQLPKRPPSFKLDGPRRRLKAPPVIPGQLELSAEPAVHNHE